MQKPFPPPVQGEPRWSSSFIDVLDRINSDPQLVERLREVERDHPYWEKFMRRVKDIGLPPEELWSYIKLQRRTMARSIHLGAEADMRFAFTLTNAMQATLHKLDMHLGGSLGSATTIPEGTRDQLLVSSLMEEAIASSLLEGAATTRELAKEMLRSERPPRNTSERMVLNNYRTMRMLVDWKTEPMTQERLLEIHRSITNGTLDGQEKEGRFRTGDDVHVVDAYGEVLYTPPGHERIDGMLEALCAFANDRSDQPFIHPVVRGIVLHFMVGYVHPFVDGNGRTARALFYWYLLRNGYWLVEFLAISKMILRAPAQYARAYLHTEQDGNDLTYFLDFNLRSLHLAMQDLDQYIGRKVEERKRLFGVVRNARVNDRQSELIAIWLREPDRRITIKEVATRFNVVYQTARTDLTGLVELGLSEQSRPGRKMVFTRGRDLEQRLQHLAHS